MTINTLQLSSEVTDVGLVTISDIVEDTDDEDNTVYVREIKVFSEIPSGGTTRTLLYTLRLTASEETSVQLVAPAQTF
jgi:hypothetical protein